MRNIPFLIKANNTLCEGKLQQVEDELFHKLRGEVGIRDVHYQFLQKNVENRS